MPNRYVPTKKTIEERLMEKCSPEPNTGCWLWIGAHQPSGYGQLWNGERPEQAHRISYRIYFGKFSEKLEIDHICRQPSCINPNRLRVVSHKENMRASNTIMGINSRKTHCQNGHLLCGKNLLRLKNGSRNCRICRNEYARKRKRRIREMA